MKQILIAVILTQFLSCTGKNDNAIDARKFEEMYVELLDSAAVIQASPDSIVSPVAARILERHGTTAEQFRHTVKVYHADTRRWEEFYRNITKRMEERMPGKTTTE